MFWKDTDEAAYHDDDLTSAMWFKEMVVNTSEKALIQRFDEKFKKLDLMEQENIARIKIARIYIARINIQHIQYPTYPTYPIYPTNSFPGAGKVGTDPPRLSLLSLNLSI